jgi:hypothetical protein
MPLTPGVHKAPCVGTHTSETRTFETAGRNPPLNFVYISSLECKFCREGEPFQRLSSKDMTGFQDDLCCRSTET